MSGRQRVAGPREILLWDPDMGENESAAVRYKRAYDLHYGSKDGDSLQEAADLYAWVGRDFPGSKEASYAAQQLGNLATQGIRPAAIPPKSKTELLVEQFFCRHCGRNRAEVERVTMAQAGAPFRDQGRREFLAVTCASCGATNFFDSRKLSS